MMVLDASAVLAFLQGEDGADQVAGALAAGALTGAANWAEVAQKVVARGNDWSLSRGVLESFGLLVEPVTQADAERAAAMARKVDAKLLSFGHDLPLATARSWGLTISTSRGTTSIGIEEPALFSEPGLFLVRPDRTLYWSTTQTMPFARPHFDEILAAIDFVVRNDYPARGEYTGQV